MLRVKLCKTASICTKVGAFFPKSKHKQKIQFYINSPTIINTALSEIISKMGMRFNKNLLEKISSQLLSSRWWWCAKWGYHDKTEQVHKISKNYTHSIRHGSQFYPLLQQFESIPLRNRFKKNFADLKSSAYFLMSKNLNNFCCCCLALHRTTKLRYLQHSAVLSREQFTSVLVIDI